MNDSAEVSRAVMVVHVPYTFFPDPPGGTEVYVRALAQEQQQRGVATMVAAPADRDSSYLHEGLPVRRFAVSSSNTLNDLYGEGDRHAARSFARILDEEGPDLVHLHAFTSPVSLRLVRECRKRSVPVVFSYHTPTVSCQQGTLLRWGTQICDGALNVHRCSRCTLHGLGLDRFSSTVAGSMPKSFGRLIGRLGVSGGPWTALRMSDLIQQRHDAIRALLTEVDHCIALCQWVKDLFLHIGLPEDRVTVSRQGLCHPLSRTATGEKKVVGDRGSAVRIAFLGRLNPVKGIHILVRALHSVQAANVQLDIFGITQGSRYEEYVRELKLAASGDSRVAFHPPMSGGQVVPILCTYDAVAVPSQLLETGPMVVLEAFAAGIPVIGSRLGGIEEQVQHEVDGLLVEPASVVAWAEALRMVSGSPDLLARLRAGVLPPRTMTTAADEIEAVYAAVKSSRRSTSLYEPAYAKEHPESK
jgi:glycosyltransferase involved in cell wall biosynthesis